MARHAPHSVHGSEDKIMRVRDGASTWVDIPGLNDWDRNAGERDGRSTVSDSGSPTGLAGAISAPTVEITAYAVPGHRSWEVIREAFDANAELRFQQELAAQTLVATTAGSNTAAIAGTGVVTFAGTRPTEDDLRIGARIRIGTNDYVIGTVNPETLATTVNPAPSSAVTAAVYSIRTAALQREFAGKVLATPDYHGNVSQGGELQGTLRIQLRGKMPRWTALAP